MLGDKNANSLYSKNISTFGGQKKSNFVNVVCERPLIDTD